MRLNRFAMLAGWVVGLTFSFVQLFANPLDAPRGIWGVWKTAHWDYANHYLTEDQQGNDILWIQEEYKRQSDLHANVQNGRIANQTTLINHYNLGENTTGVFADQKRSVFMDQLQYGYHSPNYPAHNAFPIDLNFPNPHLLEVSFPNIIGTYALNTALSMNDARNYIDEIVNDVAVDHLFSEGLMGYDIFGEIITRDDDDAQQDEITTNRAITLVDYAIDKIRERDKVRPIVWNHNIVSIWLPDPTSDVTMHQDSVVFQDIFNLTAV